MATDQPLLRIDDLHVFYGMSHVLQGTSLDVPPGRVTALVGRNGAGKTTLVNSIMGLLPVGSGSIRYRETELTSLSATRRKGLGIGLAPQGRRVFRSLTVDEHLNLVSSTKDNPFTREWVFETFPRLAERRKSLASTLSGGEQSMLAIGRALTVNPQLLIMDEPTEGLAPLLVETVRQVVEQLRQMGITVLLVEQNLQFALDVASDIAVMHRGQIDRVYARNQVPGVSALGDLILSGRDSQT